MLCNHLSFPTFIISQMMVADHVVHCIIAQLAVANGFILTFIFYYQYILNLVCLIILTKVTS